RQSKGDVEQPQRKGPRRWVVIASSTAIACANGRSGRSAARVSSLRRMSSGRQPAPITAVSSAEGGTAPSGSMPRRSAERRASGEMHIDHAQLPIFAFCYQDVVMQPADADVLVNLYQTTASMGSPHLTDPFWHAS